MEMLHHEKYNSLEIFDNYLMDIKIYFYMYTQIMCEK